MSTLSKAYTCTNHKPEGAQLKTLIAPRIAAHRS